MRNPDQRTVFAGVDARSEARLPAWYAAYHRARDPVTFVEAIRQLPTATRAKVAFSNPFFDIWVERFRDLADTLEGWLETNHLDVTRELILAKAQLLV